MLLLLDLPPENILSVATSRRSIAALARTNRRLYSLVTQVLYELNITRSPPPKSCILWGARDGRLGTIKPGRQHVGDVNLDLKDTNWKQSGTVKSWCVKEAAVLLIRHGAYLHAPEQPAIPFLVERSRLHLITPLLEQPGADAGAVDISGKDTSP